METEAAPRKRKPTRATLAARATAAYGKLQRARSREDELAAVLAERELNEALDELGRRPKP